jgi:hypothetical protein
MAKKSLWRFEKGDRVVVRTRDAGVFTGYFDEMNGQFVALTQARRLWKWSGAATLSEWAQLGPTDIAECRMPCEVDYVLLPEMTEMLFLAPEAAQVIDSIPIWTARTEPDIEPPQPLPQRGVGQALRMGDLAASNRIGEPLDAPPTVIIHPPQNDGQIEALRAINYIEEEVDLGNGMTGRIRRPAPTTTNVGNETDEAVSLPE